ncbi:MAG: lamin tail domain-containing protein [Verrucomicrobiaceae bacterium]
MPTRTLLLSLASALILSNVHADLIAHWRFDESSGTTATEEINSNNGTWVPGIDTTPDWRPTEGLLGGAVELPGNGTHLNFFSTAGFSPLNGTPDGMSISVWVKPNGNSGYRGILMTRTVSDSVGGSATQNYGLAHDSTGADGRVSGQSVDSAAGSLVSSTEWIHVCWVWDNQAGNQRIYINGVQSGPTQTSSGAPANLDILSNGEWRIGDDACCPNRNFDGFIDDLGAWDEPLSANRVQQLYQNGLNGFAIGESPGATPLNVGLVINEIHYDPEDKTDPVEFIELLNTNATPLDLDGLTFSNGVTFTFPPSTTIASTEHILITENAAALNAAFSTIPSGTQIFEFTGSLSNDGETITLINSSGAVIDTVDYQSSFPWPISPNGEGDSMQLTIATLDNDLGGAWKGAIPTPGETNANFSTAVAPLIRQVNHTPTTPTSSQATVITTKVTDSDGVASVNLLYQIVAPGAYIPAYLPNDYSTLTSSPSTPQSPNPAFEDPANWTTLAMVDNGTNGDLLAGDSIFTATIPAQINRTLVRYRIVSEDTLTDSIRAPFADDPSLNFAYFVYNGVPAYTSSTTTHSVETLTSLPVYTMITRDDDRAYAFAYSTTGDSSFQIPKGNVAARQVYNWGCSLVYDGVVYDHLGWRLRQRNDRYAGNGKRSLRFRFNRGSYFQARDEDGSKLPVKWRRMNTSKMSRFGGTNSYGLYETMNSKLWRMVGVEAPYFLPAHFRMIDGTDEAPDQYNGDFFGFTTVVQDIDGRLLDERKLPDGNMYKLKDGVTNPLELQRNQAATAVSDASDFTNIKDNLNATQNESWLLDHVDWDQWNRYHAVVEAVRHYDYGTPSTHFKNRAWYFTPGGSSFGRLRIIPHDHDASWSKGYHDNLNDVGNSIGTGFPWAAIFGANTRPPAGPESPNLTRNYRNFIREFRDLLWQEETVNTILDDHSEFLSAFTLADQDRWKDAPAAAGDESMVDIEALLPAMKSMAFTSDTMYGSNLVGGRAAFLEQISADPAIPTTPTISYSGFANFPVGSLSFDTTAFADPQGSGTFAALEWRIAEVSAPTALPADRAFEWNASWTSGEITSFNSSISPPAVATKAGSTYRARVRHQDMTGNWSHWSAPLEFTASIPDLSLFTSSLVISEIMYHPSDPTPSEIAAGFDDDDFFEFIEIRNVSTNTVDLTDIRFTKGVDFDFAGSAITSLAPGEYVLVVEHVAAFEMRYGTGHPVAGAWSGKLDNFSERIKLSYGSGEPVIDFTYFDSGPWPAAADGSGSSMTLVHPGSLPDPSNGLQWRASAPTPGSTDTTTFPGGTPAALLTYATGNTSSSTAILPDGNVSFTVTVNQLADDLEAILQRSTDLNDWSLTSPVLTLTSVTPTSGDFAELTFTTSTPPPNTKLFLRYFFSTN